MTANVEELQRLNQLYRGVVEMSALINSITEFDELLSAILDVASRVMRAEASSLFLARPYPNRQKSRFLRAAESSDG
jgi:hypothetical protein